MICTWKNAWWCEVGAGALPIVEGGFLTATQQMNSSLAWDMVELAQNSSPIGCAPQSTRIHSLQTLFKLKVPFMMTKLDVFQLLDKNSI